jgi:hypothetical protein
VARRGRPVARAPGRPSQLLVAGESDAVPRAPVILTQDAGVAQKSTRIRRFESRPVSLEPLTDQEAGAASFTRRSADRMSVALIDHTKPSAAVRNANMPPTGDGSKQHCCWSHRAVVGLDGRCQ